MGKTHSSTKRRKNYSTSVAIMAFLSACILCIIFFIDPNDNFAIPVFISIIYIALIFALSFLFANTKRGMLVSTAIIILMILASIDQANFLNILLVVGAYISFEIFSLNNN